MITSSRRLPLPSIAFLLLLGIGRIAAQVPGNPEDVVALLRAVRVPLDEVITRIAGLDPEGQIVRAELVARQGKPSWSLSWVHGDRILPLHVDALSGAISGLEALPEAAVPGLVTGFEEDPDREIPAGFRPAPAPIDPRPATWSVRTDAHAAEGRKCLQVEAAGTGDTYNLLLSHRRLPADLDLSVRLRARTGKEDQGGGLVWRAVDRENYYLTRWNPLEKNLRVYRVQNGVRSQFASVDIDAVGEDWHEIAVRSRGSKGSIRFDGKAVLTFEDATFDGRGQVGLWTKADASTDFDSFRCTGK